MNKFFFFDLVIRYLLPGGILVSLDQRINEKIFYITNILDNRVDKNCSTYFEQSRKCCLLNSRGEI